MVPVIVHDIGNWLDQFASTLDRWEKLLCELRASYLRGDQQNILLLCVSGEEVQRDIARDKQTRQQLLEQARELGYNAANFRELSRQLDSQWPALWTHRIQSLENQLNRIQQLSMSLWVSAFQSREFVSEMIRILATGRSANATYSPTESSSHEGGFMVNEAA
ncbi:MAG: hypothetical protein ACK52S_10215 [Pirellula sp.]|jgi:hypothetical protein